MKNILFISPMWRDEIEHHLYHLDLWPRYQLILWDHFQKMRMDFLLSLLPHNFSKFVGLYPARITTSKDFIGALILWVGILGVPKKFRSDCGSQFTSNLSKDLSALLGYKHLVVLPYRPQANGLAERRMHDRDHASTYGAIIFDKLSEL